MPTTTTVETPKAPAAKASAPRFGGLKRASEVCAAPVLLLGAWVALTPRGGQLANSVTLGGNSTIGRAAFL